MDCKTHYQQGRSCCLTQSTTSDTKRSHWVSGCHKPSLCAAYWYWPTQEGLTQLDTKHRFQKSRRNRGNNRLEVQSVHLVALKQPNVTPCTCKPSWLQNRIPYTDHSPAHLAQQSSKPSDSSPWTKVCAPHSCRYASCTSHASAPRSGTWRQRPTMKRRGTLRLRNRRVGMQKRELHHPVTPVFNQQH
eukprot:4132946-Amphidinium_carterae.1